MVRTTILPSGIRATSRPPATGARRRCFRPWARFSPSSWSGSPSLWRRPPTRSWPRRPVRCSGRPGFPSSPGPWSSPPPCRREPRRQAGVAPPRGMGAVLTAGQLQGGRHRRVHPPLRLPEHRLEGDHRARGPEHAGLHALAARDALHLRAGECDGRTRLRARHGPDQAPEGERHPGRADQGLALHLPPPDGVLRRRGEGVRLVAPRSEAPLHAGRRLVGRLRLRLDPLSDPDRAGDRARHPGPRRLGQGRDRHP